MPILAAFIASILTSLVDFFVVYFSRTVALKLAFAAMLVSAVGIASLAINALVVALSMPMPVDMANAFSMVLPSNMDSCLSAIAATEAICAGLRIYSAGIGAR